MADLIPSTAVTTGTPEVVGYGTAFGFCYNASWSPGNTWNIAVSSTAGDFNLGQSPICRVVPTSCITLNNRLFFVSGAYWYGSANGDPTAWDIQTPSAFNIRLFDRGYSTNDFVGLCSYQGRIALFAPQAVQIWTLSSDADAIAKVQDLLNIGTEWPLSIQPLGDLDVLFAHSSGVRSLQVRDSSLNASVVDIGTPIDNTVVAAINAAKTNGTPICATVEPESGRYWLYANGTIFVLSYFSAVKITAWSTYTPTYVSKGFGYIFTPTKFVVKDNILYCLATDGIYKYSGTDSTLGTFETPYLEVKTPGVMKRFTGFDAIFTGSWSFSLCADPWSDTKETVLISSQFTSMGTGTKSTFDIGHVPVSLRGTHIRIRGTATHAASLGGLFLQYQQEGEK